MKDNLFTPKLFTLLKKGIGKKQIQKDIIAGLIVGIVALPLAIAFAIASGVSPDKGLITAIIAGFIISAFGGSRVQIGGPTGAFIVIVYAIVQEHGISGLTIATFMAGFILIGFGLVRLGNLLKYIPYPLIVGFTSGIALIIFSSQVKDFLGLPIDIVPSDFIDKWTEYASQIHNVNWMSMTIAVSAMLISFYFHRLTTKIPGSIIAILLCTFVVYFFNLPIDTIETSFGEIPRQIPFPSFPIISFDTVKKLIQPAFAIALLGGIESLLSAVVADGMIGSHHRSNAELVAQGIANCFSAIFGGIPATGAIARTATNVKNGGRTPIAGITHALVLLFIMLLFAPFAKLIPMPCLAGILVVVAYHMSEWRQFISLLKGNTYDVLILLVTFFLTVIFDLIIAIEIGIVLSSFVFMKRMSELTTIQLSYDIQDGINENEKLFDEELPILPRDVSIYEINGALFFGAAQAFQDTITQLQKKPKVLILRMRNVPLIDATGIYRLKEVIKKFNSDNTTTILSGINEQVKADLEKAGIYNLINPENLLSDMTQSLNRAKEIVESKS